MNRRQLAKNYFCEGYACSQAVVLAFSDLVDVDSQILQNISIPFGGGMGRLRLTCGAFSGIAMIVGILFSKNENTKENKAFVYSIIQELAKRFEEQLGSVSCKELLLNAGVEVTVGGNPEARTNEYYQKRHCAEIVYKAAGILEDYLIEVEYLK